MLQSLSIRNLLLIDRLDLSFDDGLCALTGETGAGKSILLDALGLALGARAESRLLRPDCGQASVTAAFGLPAAHPAWDLLAAQDLASDDDLLLMRRTLVSDGRSRGFVNDQAVSIGLMQQLAASLVEVQGQFEAHGLMDSASHRGLLDAFGGLAAKTTATTRAWQDWRAAQAALTEAAGMQARAVADGDLLRHDLAELEALDPQPGEAESLADQRRLMAHREQLVAAVNGAMAALSGETGAAEPALNGARRLLERAAEHAGGGLDPVLANLERAAAELAEAEAGLTAFAADLDLDPEAQARIEERYFATLELARKHGCAPDALAALRQEMAGRLAALDAGDQQLTALRAAQAEARGAYLTAAETLSAARQAAARKLDRAVNKELPPLKLEKARFATRIEVLRDEEGVWGAAGFDRVGFEVATNPGLKPGPIGRIASGGELARFLLALKVVLAGLGPPLALVFDEVDSGIGGAAAHAVGERLARLAEGRQILVVTHSPQVAARADHHWRVSKEAAGRQAVSRVRALDAAERREEIARMISGAEITEEARAAAGRLLGAA